MKLLEKRIELSAFCTTMTVLCFERSTKLVQFRLSKSFLFLRKFLESYPFQLTYCAMQLFFNAEVSSNGSVGFLIG